MSTAEARRARIEPYLRALVECGGSDLHCKVGLAAAGPHRRPAAQAAGPRCSRRRTPRRSCIEVLRPDLRRGVPPDQRGRLRLLLAGRRPVPRQRRSGPAARAAWCSGASPSARSRWRTSGLPRRAGAAGARAAWSGARHRPDRLRQDDDARRDDRPHQQQPRGPRRDDRGPDRGPALRQARR